MRDRRPRTTTAASLAAAVLVAAIGVVASARTADAPPRLGRFEGQVDRIGACRAVAFDASGDVMFVDGDGRLVGGPESGAPSNLRDLAVAGDGRVAVVGDDGFAWWSPEDRVWHAGRSESGIAVGLSGDSAAILRQDGSVIVFEPGAGEERWRRDGAYPGALGIAVLPDGGVWIADTDRHRLVRLDPSGTPARAVGDRGAFPGLFSTPVDLAIAGDRLFVADMLNHRISVHDLADAAFLDQWGMHAVVPREGDGRIHYPEGVAVAADGTRAVVLEPFERRCQIFGAVPEGEAPSGSTLPEKRGIESHFGTDIAADGSYLAMWEPESATAVAFDLRYGIPIHVAAFGHGGPAPVGFGRLVATGVDGEHGEIWLVDGGHRRLHRWMLRSDRPDELIHDPFMGRFARGWSFEDLASRIAAVSGTPVRGVRPVDLVVVEGMLHLLDAAGPAIVLADRTLGVDRVVPLPAELRPDQLAVRGDGGWLVVDGDRRRLVGIGPDGTVDRDLDLGALGLVHPFGVVEAAGLVVISDRGTDRLVSIDDAGTIVATAGETGAWDAALWRPAGLAVIPWPDGGTVVAVVDQGNHRAQGFDPTTGEWKVTFSLGQGHDVVRLKREDFEPTAGPPAAAAPEGTP